ncbi:MAG TPA: gamma-glutamyl-gamma-aminobutyrate hydrolase family protein [Fimbriiglobus sp.]|jgi:putative glutamine amidotransferase
MPRPVIGIATQTLQPTGELPKCWIMGQRYVEVLRQAGAVPWLLPLFPGDPDTMREIFQRLDGVFLTGGADVDPSHYGESKEPFCGATDLARDAIEIMLLKYATEAHLPVLAVCRGIQILNVAFGGTLYQDVTKQVPAALKHDYFPTPAQPSRSFLAHDIAVKQGSRLAEILGGSMLPVNSMHHQAIKDLAPGLKPTAYAPDGIIEGVEGTNGQFLIAVQWHPEELADSQPGMKRLFSTFVEAAT